MTFKKYKIRSCLFFFFFPLYWEKHSLFHFFIFICSMWMLMLLATQKLEQNLFLETRAEFS